MLASPAPWSGTVLFCDWGLALTTLGYCSAVFRFSLPPPCADTAIESQGGRIQSVFFAVDSYDVLAITEFPEGFSPSALDIAFSAGGEVALLYTTRFLDPSEAAVALSKASHELSQPVVRFRALAASGD